MGCILPEFIYRTIGGLIVAGPEEARGGGI